MKIAYNTKRTLLAMYTKPLINERFCIHTYDFFPDLDGQDALFGAQSQATRRAQDLYAPLLGDFG